MTMNIIITAMTVRILIRMVRAVTTMSITGITMKTAAAMRMNIIIRSMTGTAAATIMSITITITTIMLMRCLQAGAGKP